MGGDSDEDFEIRKKGILAIESLKDNARVSAIEQNLDKVKTLQNRYMDEREKLEERLKKETEKNSNVKMRPVQTEDGRTVMKLESGVDENTQKSFQKAISQLEEKSSKKHTWIIENIKELIS